MTKQKKERLAEKYGNLCKECFYAEQRGARRTPIARTHDLVNKNGTWNTRLVKDLAHVGYLMWRKEVGLD